MNAFGQWAFILAGCLAAPMFTCGQTPPSAVANGIGPRIQFNSENYDFEKILAGVPVKYTFIATNTGDATLEISNAKGSCTCTVVGDGTNKSVWTLQKVEPGQTCRIPIEIATANYAGQNLAKFVTVTSNDKTRPVVNLQIHGKIWMPIEVSPPSAIFDLAAETASNTIRVFKIHNRMETPLTLSDPIVSTNVFSVTFKTNVPGQEFELTVTAAPPSRQAPTTATTTIQGNISFKSSCPQMNPLQIGVYETIFPEVTVYPSAGIQLFPTALPQPVTNFVTIRGNSASLTLSDAAVNVPGVRVSIHTVQTNWQYNLAVVFPAGFEIPAGQNVALTVKTDNARFPILTIPVTAMRRQFIVPQASSSNGLLVPPNLLRDQGNQAKSAVRVNPPHP